MAASPQDAFAGSLIGDPELRLAHGSEMKLARQHADDDSRLAIQRDHLPQYVALATIAMLPGSVAQQGRVRCSGDVVGRGEIPPQRRSDAQRAKETVGHASAVRDLWSGGRAQH